MKNLISRLKTFIIIKNERGSIFIGLALSLGMLVLVTVYYQQEIRQRVILNSFSQVLATSFEIQKASTRSLLSDSQSKAVSLNSPKNANLKICQTTDCPVSGEQNLVLLDQVGNVVFDGASSNGISPMGTSCDTFDEAAGNDSCPYKYKVTWSPDCPPIGACFAPNIIVKAYVKVKFASASSVSKLNVTRFNYSEMF